MDHGTYRGVDGAYGSQLGYPPTTTLRPSHSPGPNLADLRKRVLAYSPPTSQAHPSYYDDYYGARDFGQAPELVRQVCEAIVQALGPDLDGGGPLLSELDARIAPGSGQHFRPGLYGMEGYGQSGALSTEAERNRVADIIERALSRLDRRVTAESVVARSWPHGHLPVRQTQGTDVGIYDDLLADVLAETRKARRMDLPLLARAGAGVVLMRLMDLVGISGGFTTERRMDALASAAGLRPEQGQALMRLVVDGSRPDSGKALHDAGFEALERTISAMVETGRLKARQTRLR